MKAGASSAMADECLFCGAGDGVKLSEEHIVPKWLLHALNLPSHDKTFHGVWDAHSGQLVRRNVGKTFRFVEERICEKACNNGWMSRLEKKVELLIPDLANQVRRLSSLTRSERTLLAKWAAKTAYLHTTAGLLDKPVQSTHLQALYTDLGHLASRVAVFATQGDFPDPSSYVQTGCWPQQSVLDPGSAPPPEAYKIAIQYRHLALLVAFWPNPTAVLQIPLYYFPVWSGGWKIKSWSGLVYSREPTPLLRFANDLGTLDPPRIVIPGFSMTLR